MLKEEYTQWWSQYAWDQKEQLMDEERMANEEKGFGEGEEDREYE
jgi:hypothetical protein